MTDLGCTVRAPVSEGVEGAGWDSDASVAHYWTGACTTVTVRNWCMTTVDGTGEWDIGGWSMISGAEVAVETE